MATKSGILTREDILAEVRAGKLIKGHAEENVHASSYDMRIGTVFDRGRRITNAQKGGEDAIVLQPGAIISLFTSEELDLPKDITATAFAMNSLSSNGVLVFNPGHVDPGYSGPLTVRIINLCATPKAIALGASIFTVIFERLPHATERGYEKNIPRETRERDFTAIDLEQNPRSLFRLIQSSEENNFLTGEEVDRRISQHWMGQTIFWLSFIGAIGVIITTIVSLAALYVSLNPKSETNVAAPNPTPIVVTIPQQTQNSAPNTTDTPGLVAPKASGAADKKNQKKQ